MSITSGDQRVGAVKVEALRVSSRIWVLWPRLGRLRGRVGRVASVRHAAPVTVRASFRNGVSAAALSGPRLVRPSSSRGVAMAGNR